MKFDQNVYKFYFRSIRSTLVLYILEHVNELKNVQSNLFFSKKGKNTVILAWYILKGHLTSLLDCTFFRQIDLVNVGAVCVLILLVDFLTFNTFY